MRTTVASLLAGAALAIPLAACGEPMNETDRASATATNPAVANQGFDGVPGDPRLLDLRAVEEPATTLAGADVRDRLGRPIGAVQGVELAADGGVDAITVALDDGRLVRATPLEARYDETVDTVEIVVEVSDLPAPIGEDRAPGAGALN